MRQLGLPNVVNLVLTKIIVNPRKLNVLRQSTAVILLNAMKLLFLVFLNKLRADLSSLGDGTSGPIVFKLTAFIIPVIVNAKIVLTLNCDF